MGPWMGAAHQKIKTMFGSLELSAPHPLPFSRKGRGAGNGAHHQSCLCDEASIKSPKYRVQRASGSWKNNVSGQDMEALTLSHTPYSMHLFCLNFHLYPLPYLFIINRWIVSQLLPWVLWAILANSPNSRKGVWEPPTHSRTVSSTGDPLDLWPVSEVGRQESPVRLSPHPAESYPVSGWIVSELI